MIPKEKQAAEMLLGKELKGGWKVIKKYERAPFKTGGVYSSCYEVEKEGRKGFLKAFDYSAADKVGKSFPDQMKDILNAYTFEREILEKCYVNRCKNVIQLIDYGDLEITDADKYPRVDYLILEYAQKGDVRNALQENRATLEWKLRSLHQLTKGLRQIHNIFIAHQDVKPSNIVTLENGITKITDLGSAISLNYEGKDLPPHLEKPFSGTWEYAPPELLYGEINNDSIIRRIGCDLYLLGSMIAFYFTDMSMTSLIKANLEDALCWTNPSTYGKYDEIKAYLIMAYEKALEDIKARIIDDEIKDQIILAVKYLCNPDPQKRGHKKNIGERGPNYNLERFVNMFDRMAITISLKKRA